MVLTERQRWEVMRQMVKDKNDEYSSFLLRFLDTEQLRQVIGHTRETFLKQCGFDGLADFNDYIRLGGKKPVQEWLNNLSSEDLLIFLDFRCKILYKMYRHYKMYRSLNKNDVISFIDSTKVTQFIQYNYGKLMCTGRPVKQKGEDKVEYLDDDREVKESAIKQTMQNLATTFALEREKPIARAQEEVVKLETFNVDNNGYITGYRLRNKELEEGTRISINNKPKFIYNTPQKQENQMKMVGYDINGAPIFYLNGQYMDFFKNPIREPQIKQFVNNDKKEHNL